MAVLALTRPVCFIRAACDNSKQPFREINDFVCDTVVAATAFEIVCYFSHWHFNTNVSLFILHFYDFFLFYYVSRAPFFCSFFLFFF